MTRRSRVTLEGDFALTINEARALIRAATIIEAPIMKGQDKYLAGAIEKLAEGLLGAGQDRHAVQQLLEAR